MTTLRSDDDVEPETARQSVSYSQSQSSLPVGAAARASQHSHGQIVKDENLLYSVDRHPIDLRLISDDQGTWTYRLSPSCLAGNGY